MKTVTVRIPVAVDADGNWCVGSMEAACKDNDKEESSRENAEFCSLGEESIVWITAEVPVPEQAEVQGRVEG